MNSEPEPEHQEDADMGQAIDFISDLYRLSRSHFKAERTSSFIDQSKEAMRETQAAWNALLDRLFSVRNSPKDANGETWFDRFARQHDRDSRPEGPKTTNLVLETLAAQAWFHTDSIQHETVYCEAIGQLLDAHKTWNGESRTPLEKQREAAALASWDALTKTIDCYTARRIAETLESKS